jgi:hypothetical protein
LRTLNDDLSSRDVDQTRLPLRAAAFAALVAILALSGWREWGPRDTELKNVEVDMSNRERSLRQYAEDMTPFAFDTLWRCPVSEVRLCLTR